MNPDFCYSLLQLGMSGIAGAVQGDYLKMSFPDEEFDAAYAIESTCHAAKVCFHSLFLWRACDVRLALASNTFFQARGDIKDVCIFSIGQNQFTNAPPPAPDCNPARYTARNLNSAALPSSHLRRSNFAPRPVQSMLCLRSGVSQWKSTFPLCIAAGGGVCGGEPCAQARRSLCLVRVGVNQGVRP